MSKTTCTAPHALTVAHSHNGVLQIPSLNYSDLLNVDKILEFVTCLTYSLWVS